MDKKKKQLVITGVLLVVMVLMMARNFLPSKKGPAGGAKAASIPALSTETMTANMGLLAIVRQNESIRLQQEEPWQKPWSKDPFALADSKGGSVGSAGNFVLSGIVWDENMPVAILNQKLTKAGDEIDGCRVREIRRSSVTLVCGEQTFDLQLFHAQDAGVGEKQARP